VARGGSSPGYPTRMKALVKILLAGFVAFMVLAVGQEWDFFSSAWFGNGDSGAAAVSELDQQAAEEAVLSSLTVMRHFYASGGDDRFAERMPASEVFIREMAEDVEYLMANRRLQDPELKHLETLGIRALSADQVEIRTKEIWLVRTLWIDGSGEADPAEWQVLHARYLVGRTPVGWMVQAWEISEPLPADESGDGESETTSG
jgi:hypothetical protein